MSVYLLMALMLWLRPRGLFPAPTSISDQPAAAHVAELDPAGSRNTRRIAIGLCLALLILVPFLNEPFYTRLFTRILILGLAALSLDLIFGFGGMVSFGHAAFLGVGAYVVGIAAHHGMTEILLVWPMAILAGALSAILIGAIALRTSGIYFIMITLAFGQMLYFIGVSLEAYGGDNGLPLKLHSSLGGLFTLSDPRALFAVSLALLAGCLWLSGRFVRSEFGVALCAIRDNERRMRAIGYPTFRYRLAAFTLSGGIAGLAGALLVNVDSYVGPSSLHWFVSGELMIMVILGGAATLFGPVAGAALFLLLEEGLSGLTEHWMLIFGPLLVLIVLFTRGGLYGLLSRMRHA
jgi:branched-chain amino acid transport system permease protein